MGDSGDGGCTAGAGGLRDDVGEVSLAVALEFVVSGELVLDEGSDSDEGGDVDPDVLFESGSRVVDDESYSLSVGGGDGGVLGFASGAVELGSDAPTIVVFLSAVVDASSAGGWAEAASVGGGGVVKLGRKLWA